MADTLTLGGNDQVGDARLDCLERSGHLRHIGNLAARLHCIAHRLPHARDLPTERRARLVGEPRVAETDRTLERG